MPNTSELRLRGATLSYRVIIDGVQEGHTLEHVAARLAELFRRTVDQMHTLLAAPRAIVKKQLDCSHALRFQAALERAGCVAVIEPDHTDFSTLVLCHHVSPGPGIAINTPEAWHASMDDNTFQLLDEASGACLRAVGVTSAALSIREWADQRMRWVAEDMPYLRQVRAPYRMEGAGWDDRVQGVAAEYRGTFPGTGVYSHYLVLCLRSARSLVCLTVHAPAAVFDVNEGLYRWLLGTQLDVCDAAPEPVPLPLPVPLSQEQADEQQDVPPLPQPVALSPHDEALQRWLRYNEARPSRRLLQHKTSKQ
ncbi:hypothetical protein GJ700_11970 [Duganella sp. FT92W]|uniref:Uncharacterized protein n=1 Tax=Pseudoduganella rivuli TaxID=2666085 RepID=A0A7X2IMQ2_9BURK|nr:hypothetical protein [Pseudoduganella rivuli]MRV72427.1 hypothetical protein [Pseudoduganella rivuli]